MTKNKLQYWIYAILNKQFGKEVLFHRDSLHKVYEVNRHSFEIATNTMDINTVKKWLINTLVESGYKNSEKEPNFYNKEIDDKEFCITFHQQSRGLDYRFSDRPIILIGIHSYQKRSSK